MTGPSTHRSSQGSIPLFSPTQAAPFGEHVLHSIFSPTFRGGITSATMKQKYDNVTRQRVKKDRVKQAAKRLTVKTPSPMQSLRRPPKDLLDFGSPIDHLNPPEPSATKPLFGSSERTWEPPYVSHSKSSPGAPSPPLAVLSPLSFMSPLSKTNSSDSTQPSLTMDKLSFDYVSSSVSIEDLEQVVAALSASTPRQYPSLLRSAKKRLSVLRESSPSSNSSNDECEQNAAPRVRFAEILTLSPAKSAIESPGIVSVPSNDTASLAMSFSESSVEEHEDLLPDQSPVVIEEDELSAGNSHEPEAPGKQLWVKLQALEMTKIAAEHDLEVLTKELATSTAEIETVAMSLACAERENDGLRDRLLEKESNLKETRIREGDLLQTVSRLSDELEKSRAIAEEMSENIESRVRRRYEDDVLRLRHRVSKLTANLDEARRTLGSVKDERNEMLKAIQSAMGKPTDKIETYSKEDRMGVLKNMAETILASQAASESLSKTLASIRSDQKHTLAAKLSSDRDLKASKTIVRQLELQNIELVNRLEKVPVVPEKFKKWELKEAEYKSTIRSLRSQIRNGEAMVSMALYRRAISESRARTLECSEKKNEVQALSAKLASLQRQAKNQATSTADARGKYNFTHGRVARISPIDTDDKSVTNQQKAPPPPPPRGNKSPVTPKLSYRLTAVRDAGGKAGLRAKLQRIRRSPLTRKMNAVT